MTSPFADRLPHAYILKGREIVRVSFLEWADWFGRSTERFIVSAAVGPLTVSTIFIGIDHNYLRTGPPLVFETAILEFDVDGAHVFEMWRYATYDEAEAGQRVACSIAEQMVAEAAAGVMRSAESPE